MKDAELRSPVSFVANVARLPQKGLPILVEADQRQREALAAEYELLSVESYRAELLVASWKRNGVKVTGRVEADITQACIVTLEPVSAHIDEPVEALFCPSSRSLDARASRAAARLFSTPMDRTVRKHSPATRSTSVRWPNSSSAWRSTPIRASREPRSTSPATIRPRKANSRKSCVRCSENPESGPDFGKVGCAQAQNRYFRRTFASPLTLAGVRR